MNRGVIFDVDGTLVDSNYEARAFEHAADLLRAIPGAAEVYATPAELLERLDSSLVGSVLAGGVVA